MTLKQTFGQIIRSKREELGWSQEKAAEILDIPSRSLQRLEYGDYTPGFATLFKLAKGYGTTPDKLILPIWELWKELPESDSHADDI